MGKITPRPDHLKGINRLAVGHPVLAAQSARLQGRQHAQDFLAPSADAQAVHDLILHQPLRVDDEQTSHGQVVLRLIDTIGTRGRSIEVAAQREAQPTQAAARPRSGDPALVRFDRVATDAQELAILRRELVEPLREANQLGRADERKITRIKDQDQPAASIIRQAHPASCRIRKSRARQIEGRAAGLPIKCQPCSSEADSGVRSSPAASGSGMSPKYL